MRDSIARAFAVPMLLVGCSSQQEPPAAEAKTLRFDDGQAAHCTPRAERVYDVEVVDEHGASVLATTLDARYAGAIGVVWHLADQLAPRSGLLRVGGVGADTPFDCEIASKFVHAMAGARDKLLDTTPSGGTKPYDNWGCDLGPIASAVNCGSTGACCDYHDACFYNNGCSASDWYHTLYCDALPNSAACYTACDQCNVTVRSCILNESPGPSTCCQWNICGWARNPNNHWGCVSNTMCPASSTCNWNNGLCESACQPQQYCYGGQCGSVPDGCGGYLDCGSCSDPCDECNAEGEECCGDGEYCSYEGCCF